MTYKISKPLRELLRNNNHFEKEINHEKGTLECGKCSLCGNFSKNKKSMIIKESKFKNMKLKHKLNCKDYGIYGATCVQCTENNIGKTANSSEKRWNSHRKI